MGIQKDELVLKKKGSQKEVISVKWGPRKKKVNILAGGKITEVEKDLGDQVGAWKKMPGGDQRPRPVRPKTGSYEQLYIINNFLPSLPELAAISLLKREFQT